MSNSSASPTSGPLLIGMLHVPALPGSPLSRLGMAEIRDHVLRDADALCEGGMSAMMLENFGDVPFFPDRVPAATVAGLTLLANEVRSRFPQIPLGINVLRNDADSALSIAHVVAATFIRVNVLCGARVTDQGLIQGQAHDLLRLRRTLAADRVAIYADVDVKHSAPLAPRTLSADVQDLIHRGRADAVIVSGEATGSRTDQQHLAEVASVAGTIPVLVGSGVDATNITDILRHASGAIVGSALKRDGEVLAPVDPQRVREFVAAARQG